MKFQRIDEGVTTTLTIAGSLDAISTPELRASIDTLVREKRASVQVDLSALRLIDSSGVGAIVSLFKRVKNAGGSFALIGVCGQPAAVCRLLKLDRVFGL